MNNFRTLPILAAITVAVVCLAVCAFAADPLTFWSSLSMAALGMGYLLKDADSANKKSHALPNGAATTQGSGIDLGHGTAGDFLANCEVLVEAPVLTTTELADAQTITYSLEHDTASGFGGVATIPGFASVAVQTGAGGAGAAAQSIRVRLPVDVKQFIRLKTVKAGASNASTKSASVELVY
jgi:hypothetical protein